MAEIPEIEETGSTGAQQPASKEITPAHPESPFSPGPMSEVVNGLASSRPRSMGGEVAANLLAGSFAQLSNELAETKADLRATHETLDATRTNLSECETREAVLQERVSTAIGGRHLRNVALVGGTALLGIGLELGRSKAETLSLLVGGIGLLLILMGWFRRTPEPKQ